MGQEELANWLIAECEKRHLSWSAASRNAGLAPNTISEIVGGTPAGIKRLTALAEYFGSSPEYVLRLAGHLPERPTAEVEDAELRYKLQQIAEILRDLPPDLKQQLVDQIIIQTEAAKAAFAAGVRAAREASTEEQ